MGKPEAAITQQNFPSIFLLTLSLFQSPSSSLFLSPSFFLSIALFLVFCVFSCFVQCRSQCFRHDFVVDFVLLLLAPARHVGHVSTPTTPAEWHLGHLLNWAAELERHKRDKRSHNSYANPLYTIFCLPLHCPLWQPQRVQHLSVSQDIHFATRSTSQAVNSVHPST